MVFSFVHDDSFVAFVCLGDDDVVMGVEEGSGEGYVFKEVGGEVGGIFMRVL